LKSFKIAIFPGDGIGVDVTQQAERVLDQAASSSAFQIEKIRIPWGTEYWRSHGQVVPDKFLDVLRPCDAILLGAMGWSAELPDHITLAPLVKIRQAFDQYACVRPAKLYAGVPSVLASKGPDQIDFVVIRENSEGEYVDHGGRFHVGQPDEVAWQTAIHSRRGVERILRFGFQMARTRRKRLTMVTKSNAQRFGYVLWDEILEQLKPQFRDVEADKQHADACLMNLVRWPERFDVIVASNLFGDLLTDLGGLIGGGLGLAPSTNTNPERSYPSMFEPVHGSAPDIAGKGIANPIAAILSVAMMLDHLQEATAAQRIRQAVQQAIADRKCTPDIGGTCTTEQAGTAVVERLGNGS